MIAVFLYFVLGQILIQTFILPVFSGEETAKMARTSLTLSSCRASEPRCQVAGSAHFLRNSLGFQAFLLKDLPATMAGSPRLATVGWLWRGGACLGLPGIRLGPRRSSPALSAGKNPLATLPVPETMHPDDAETGPAVAHRLGVRRQWDLSAASALGAR